MIPIVTVFIREINVYSPKPPSGFIHIIYFYRNDMNTVRIKTNNNKYERKHKITSRIWSNTHHTYKANWHLIQWEHIVYFHFVG
jgi:hypothetical protein